MLRAGSHRTFLMLKTQDAGQCNEKTQGLQIRFFKSSTYLNLSAAFLERRVMREMHQMMLNVNAMGKCLV